MIADLVTQNNRNVISGRSGDQESEVKESADSSLLEAQGQDPPFSLLAPAAARAPWLVSTALQPLPLSSQSLLFSYRS